MSVRATGALVGGQVIANVGVRETALAGAVGGRVGR
jgi:hypothetical protein